MKQQWAAKDNKAFDSHEECRKHEDTLFQAWLGTNPQVFVLGVMEALSDAPDDWDGSTCSQREMFEGLLRTYWETL